MIAVETIIRKLVSDLEFVIIPGFGALLSHQVQAIYDKDSEVISPPVKKLAFNEFLKLDDGLLANYISREEKITHLEAVAYIKTYVDSLRSSLKLEGHTKIEGIGEFTTNIEGKLVFGPNTSNYFKDEWYGFKKVAAKTFGRDALPQASVLEKDDNQVEVDTLYSDRVINVNWIKWGAAAVLAGLMFFISFYLVTSDKENNKSTLNPFDSFFTSRADTKIKDITIDNTSKPYVKPVLKSAKISSDFREADLAKNRVSVAGKVNTVNTPVLTGSTDIKPKFYLIAGAFKGTRQAKVLLAEMQSKGYNEAIIIPSSRNSKKVKVAVGSFDDEKQAYHASVRLRSVIKDNGWVFKSI